MGRLPQWLRGGVDANARSRLAGKARKEKLMSAQDDYARDPVRPPAERWAADSPFVSEAVAEEQAPIHPWYQGYTPFVEGRELEETYTPEAEWDPECLRPGPNPIKPEELDLLVPSRNGEAGLSASIPAARSSG